MLNFYSSTRVNRPPEGKDRATAGLRSNRFKASIIKKWLCTVLCLLFLFSASWAAVPQAVHADEEGYLLDRMITWADGSIEHVQIDPDGYFCLDGVRKRLVGFCTAVSFASGNWFDEANLAILHTELDYLQTRGVRIIKTYLPYVGLNYEYLYDGPLQLLYDHKMLVVAEISHKSEWPESFGSLSPVDFNFGYETVSQQMPKWVDKVISYSNVVTIVFEKEPEYLEGEENYTVSLFVDYLNLIRPTITSRTNLPIITPLLEDQSTEWRLSMQSAVVPFVSIPCHNYYFSDEEDFGLAARRLNAWNIAHGKNSQMWIGEMGSPSGGVQAASMTKGMIDQVLANNVSAVFLFAMNWQVEEGGSFFDADGAPVANTETLMRSMATWQAPISEPATIPIVATTGASNITLTSAKK